METIYRTGKQMMPKYSLIIPVYNASNFLRQCIDSVLCQAYTDFELLLIDDCSTDSSLAICREYSACDTRVRIFAQESNQGVSAARNLGIENARGQYILFLDSDDFISIDYFETIESALDENIELLSFGNSKYFMRENGEVAILDGSMNIEKECSDNNANAWRSLALDSFFAPPWNKVFRADLIKKNNLKFDTKCVCFEDYIFNLNYCQYITSFKAIEASIYFYRMFEKINHVSKRKWGDVFDISRRVADATNAFILEKGNGKILFNIRRYSYQAYITELKACFIKEPSSIDQVLKCLTKETEFLSAVKSISPKGWTLSILNFCLTFGCNKLARKIIKDRILNNGRKKRR